MNEISSPPEPFVLTVSSTTMHITLLERSVNGTVWHLILLSKNTIFVIINSTAFRIVGESLKLMPFFAKQDIVWDKMSASDNCLTETGITFLSSLAGRVSPT